MGPEPINPRSERLEILLSQNLHALDPVTGRALEPVDVDADLVAAILANLNARTARCYLSDYRDFARFMGHAGPRGQLDPSPAIAELLAMGPGRANATVLKYRIHQADRGIKAGTIARRLSALRSACKAARRIGRISWGLDVPGPKATPYRDTRGPGADGWKKMLALAKERASAGLPKPVRDLAIIRLLSDLGLRRAEVCNLDLVDLDVEASTVAVIGKGQTEAQRITLPEPTRNALRAWKVIRGESPGPLFHGVHRGRKTTGRLTGEAVRLIVSRLGRDAGLPRPARPHGLRHTAITRALDAGRDVREVRKFSRHSKLDTVLIYDDARRDVAGDIARGLAGDDD